MEEQKHESYIYIYIYIYKILAISFFFSWQMWGIGSTMETFCKSDHIWYKYIDYAKHDVGYTGNNVGYAINSVGYAENNVDNAGNMSVTRKNTAYHLPNTNTYTCIYIHMPACQQPAGLQPAGLQPAALQVAAVAAALLPAGMQACVCRCMYICM